MLAESVDTPLNTEKLLCAESIDQLLGAAESVYVFASEPDSTLGFYPIHANRCEAQHAKS